MRSTIQVCVFSVALLLQGATHYKLQGRYPVPGTGGFDYVTLDSSARRIYLSHGTQVDVLDAAVGVAAAALGEAELLEIVDEPDHRALVDLQPPAQFALRHRAFGVDHGEHGRVLGADPLIGERALEPLRRVLRDECREVTGPVCERLGKRRCGDD